MPALIRVLALVTTLVVSRVAFAEVPCDPPTAAWVHDCAAREHVELEIAACPPGTLVVRAPGAALDVEMASATPRSFRSESGIGFSPVGQFADWSKESEPRRRVLDALTSCARVSAPPLPRTQESDVGLRPVRLPWLLIAAFALFGAGALGVKRQRREALVVIALGLAVALFRALLLPQAFFHQNGQGPAWVNFALREDVGLAGYGPGYPEVFAAAARVFAGDPERGIWLLQSALGAIALGLGYVIARSMGARAMVALGLCLALGADPMLARLARSESYFAVEIALLLMATAAFALAEPRVSARFAFAVIAGALFASQAVRIHPSAWPACVLTTLPVLLGPGRFRRRAMLFASATAVAVVVLAITSHAAIRGVVHGSIGQKWLPHVAIRWDLLTARPMPLLLMLAAIAGLTMRSWRGVVVALAGVLVLAAARVTDLLSDPNPAVTAAHQRLFAPALALLIAVFCARTVRSARSSRIAATLFMVSGVVLARARFSELTELPTDAREALFVREKRAAFEPRGIVAFLERAGSRLDVPPIYDAVTASRAPLRAEGPFPSLASLPRPAYYLHSSLCSTGEGQAACVALEKTAELELIDSRAFPARPSMRWSAYNKDPVVVSIYRVK